jgi:transposase
VYEQLGLDEFWAQRLPPSRKGTRWDLVLQTLCTYRLIDPGSEWRLYRQWFEQSAMGDLLGEDLSLVEIHKLYECLDLILAHKAALFEHLTQRWKDLFNARFDVLLYDLTSTYFESEPPFAEGDKRKFGYSRDKRSDCVQVVIALIVTPEGFPLGYEVMAGHTSDKTTLKGFLEQIEQPYGKAERIWVMDRGIPTEESLAQMRASDPPVRYLVGTPKGRLSQGRRPRCDCFFGDAAAGFGHRLRDFRNELGGLLCGRCAVASFFCNPRSCRCAFSSTREARAVPRSPAHRFPQPGF